MRLILKVSLSGPEVSLVKGDTYECEAPEALRLVAADFAEVHPEDAKEFAEAEAETAAESVSEAAPIEVEAEAAPTETTAEAKAAKGK